MWSGSSCSCEKPPCVAGCDNTGSEGEDLSCRKAAAVPRPPGTRWRPPGRASLPNCSPQPSPRQQPARVRAGSSLGQDAVLRTRIGRSAYSPAPCPSPRSIDRSPRNRPTQQLGFHALLPRRAVAAPCARAAGAAQGAGRAARHGMAALARQWALGPAAPRGTAITPVAPIPVQSSSAPQVGQQRCCPDAGAVPASCVTGPCQGDRGERGALDGPTGGPWRRPEKSQHLVQTPASRESSYLL